MTLKNRFCQFFLEIILFSTSIIFFLNNLNLKVSLGAIGTILAKVTITYICYKYMFLSTKYLRSLKSKVDNRVLRKMLIFSFFLLLLIETFIIYASSHKILISSWVNFFQILVIIFTLLLLRIISKYSNIQKNAKSSVPNKLFSLLVGAIIVLSFFTRVYNLDNENFHGDEFQVINTAAGFLKTKNFEKWDWDLDLSMCNYRNDCNYTRGWPHTALISLSFMFQISEFSARMPSVIVGVIICYLVYVITKKISDSNGALIATMLSAININFILLSRYARMYALLQLLVLLVIYFSYKSFDYKRSTKNRLINLFFLSLSTIIMFFTHINGLSIGLGILFILLICVYYKKNDSINSLVLGAAICSLGVISTLLYYDVYTFDKFLSFFSEKNYIYAHYALEFPFSLKYTIFILIGGLLTKYKKPHKIFSKDVFERNILLLLLSASLIASLVIFIYCTNRYTSYSYISHIVPIGIILFGASYSYIISQFKNKLQFLFILFLIVIALCPLAINQNSIYFNNSFANFEQGYSEIRNSYQSENSLVLLQYPRRYYLKNDNANINPISLGRNGEFTLNELLDVIEGREGWIGWESEKSGHLNSELKTYVNDNFKKIHGGGIDNTKLEIYSF